MKAYFNFNHGVPAEAGVWLEYTVKPLSCTKPHVKKLFWNPTIRSGRGGYNGLTRWGHYELPAHFLGTIFLIAGTCLIPWQDQVSVLGFSPMVSCNFSVKSALWQQQSPCKDRARQHLLAALVHETAWAKRTGLYVKRPSIHLAQLQLCVLSAVSHLKLLFTELCQNKPPWATAHYFFQVVWSFSSSACSINWPYCCVCSLCSVECRTQNIWCTFFVFCLLWKSLHKTSSL